MIKVSPQGTGTSTAKNINKIKINVYKGVTNGNIFPVTAYPASGSFEYSLDFSSEENSFYIPVV